ncbi:MAG: DUF296 domain-containing protein [Candidatus Shapirobacteria bacterium]|jgi:hypothetical protein
MQYKKIDKEIIVKVIKGEKIVEAIKEVCRKEEIVNGWIEGIGALDWAEIAHYNVANKKYSSFVLEEALEMVSLIGNVFLGEEGEIIVHTHAAVSRPDGEMRGGHLAEARIGGAGEIKITPLTSRIAKKYDEETGLKLIQI